DDGDDNDDNQEDDDQNDDEEETDSDKTESDRIKIHVLNQSSTEYYKEKEENVDDEEKMDEEEDDEGVADQQNVSQESGYEQEEEDAHVTLIAVHDTQKTDGTMQSSSVSSDFTSKLLNLEKPSPNDNEIASLMDTTVCREDPSS
ncbi:hypothetical protein Tco_0824847, partial [Tanacetum coccineum]